MSIKLRLAPGVVDLASLGDAPAEAWLRADAGDLNARATAASPDPARAGRRGEQHLRLPLPGTPGADGRRLEPPRGSGTGWLHLHRYAAGGARALAARLTAPRSSSLAARHWNLICHLRAQGVGAPELVLLGEAAGGPGHSGHSARSGQWGSFLVTRELAGFTPLSELLADSVSEVLRGRRRALILRSVGLALRGLFRSGAWLPELGLAEILVQVTESTDTDACGLRELESLREDGRTLRALGLRRRRLPAVAFTGFRRGRLLTAIGPRRRARLLASLAEGLPAGVSRREQLAVFALATARRG